MFQTVRQMMVLTGLALIVAVPPVQAASSRQAATMQGAPLYTTVYLQHLCNSTYDIDVGMCAGYIMSVADDLQQQGQACLTAQIGAEILTENIRRSWAQSPNQPAGALQSVTDILQQRFPCR